MNGRERIKRTIAGCGTDRLPRGEIVIPVWLPNRHPAWTNQELREAMLQEAYSLGLDFIVLQYGFNQLENGYSPQREDIKFFSEQGFFVFAGIPGIFWPVIEKYGFGEAARLSLKSPAAYEEEVASFAKAHASLAKELIKCGADGIFILDDMAGEQGILFSPAIMNKVVLPWLRQMVAQIKEGADVPVFLHSDGRIEGLLDGIVDSGIDGIHGLSGLGLDDLRAIKHDRLKGLTIAGNLSVKDLARLEKIFNDDLLDELQALHREGRYILSSDGGAVDLCSWGKLRQLYAFLSGNNL